MIRFIQNGNIFESKADILLNPVNCVGVMGKGLALEFKKSYPSVFSEYKKLCESKKMRLGDPVIVENVCLFPTKLHWRDPSYLNDIDIGLKNLAEVLQDCGLKSVAIPALGCGLGGLKYEEVLSVVLLRTLPLSRDGFDIEIYMPLENQ